VAAEADSGQMERLARRLAVRAAEVRWGADARDEFLLKHDPVVALGVAQFANLAALLASPSR
jgi:pilus assembly protein TadC